MKFILLAFLFSQTLFAKDATVYICTIYKNIKAELSLVDVKNPSLSLINKDSKFALCFFKTLPFGTILDKNSVALEKVWKLELNKCDYYSDKLKSKLSLLNNPSFKQSQGLSASYFQLLKDQQPLFCTPKS